MESNCCGASEWMDNTDICSECKEHAEFTEHEQCEVSREEIKKILAGIDRYERNVVIPAATHPYYYDADEEEVTDWES